MKESYEVMMDKLGKERGKPFIANLKKQKSQFDKLSYPEKLKFWEDNNLELIVTTYFFIEGENRNEPKNHISIFPGNMDEKKLYFDWYFKHLKFFSPLQYDIEKMKGNYFEKINGNPQSLYFTEIELRKYTKPKDEHFSEYREFPHKKNLNQRNTSNSYIKGFDSVAKNELINFEDKDFIFQNIKLVADGIIAANYIPFLENELIFRKREKFNPVNESSEIDNEILEVRTKLILLNELGIIKHLQGFEQFKNATELCKFLTELIETKEENKMKTHETIRKDFSLLNVSSNKNKRSPNTPTQIRKVNSILAKYGLPPINE